MHIKHILGFPRIGAQRETKTLVEQYWRGEIDQATLKAGGAKIRAANWQMQAEAGLDFVSIDFSWYDHILDASALFGVVPARFNHSSGQIDLDTVFRMARGRAPSGQPAAACEMTKWFDTNYHYIVPEFTNDQFSSGQKFQLSSSTIFDETVEAQKLGYNPKPVLIGPLSYLYLGKIKSPGINKLDLIAKLLPVYEQIFEKFHSLGVQWVQIDEPILVLDLDQSWQQAFKHAYAQLNTSKVKVLLATYFGALGDNLELACNLPTAGLHIDLVRGADQLDAVLKHLPETKILSAGIINGRNIWKADLSTCLQKLQPAHEKLKDRLWISSSCSLLHVPVDSSLETKLDPELNSWLAFAKQKLTEITTLGIGLDQGKDAIQAALTASDKVKQSRQTSTRIHKDAVQQRIAAVTPAMTKRHSDFQTRSLIQRATLALPYFPTTTIGSFPQTKEIRAARNDFKQGRIDATTYTNKMQQEIIATIKKQETVGLDVLVHGEPERNDMVEYFGELLEGFAFTQNGWVQSYGSRCVKPPVIYGDVSRKQAMTVEWSRFAQQQTSHFMKGMLTGPVTILCWSFPRDDQPRATTALQIALALRDEVKDLEAAGIKIIQIDEPAFREGLPLRRADWQEYLNWATRAFCVASAGADDHTQIHTHMCYAEFNDIIHAIADLDADVITIESSRSQMELLDAFQDFAYPNEIGPGVYDIHSPNVPTKQEMISLLEKASECIPADRLWVNPDCGLKTRDWAETTEALQNMVAAAKIMREKFV